MQSLWAYFGLGPGQELFQYFVGLLSIVFLAAGAVLQWPLFALRRLFKKRAGDLKHELSDRSTPASESNGPT